MLPVLGAVDIGAAAQCSCPRVNEARLEEGRAQPLQVARRHRFSALAIY